MRHNRYDRRDHNHSNRSNDSRRPRRVYHPPVHGRQPGEGERRFLAGTAIDPSPRIRLEDGSSEMTMRVMDLICPIGMGQRGLIVAPPGSGKTTFLKHLCTSIAKSCPKSKLYCLLINERPEEVTDFRRSVTAEVRASSLDEAYDHHIATADVLMKQIFEEVSGGQDVVLLVDSLTRLARVHNSEQRTSGRTLSGGVDARALEVPRRIFGAARKIENGGSLTILATILVDTGSRMDQVIFEEFKGTGNMEIYLSRDLSSRRIFPAVDISKSGTRKEELLLGADECARVGKIRRMLTEFPPAEAMKMLIETLAKYPTNSDLFATIDI